MPERLWGLRMQSRFGKVDVWYGYWLSRSDALGYLTREAGGIGDGGELASMHADWFTVEPIEWVEGRDTQLRVIEPLSLPATAERRNAGGDA